MNQDIIQSLKDLRLKMDLDYDSIVDAKSLDDEPIFDFHKSELMETIMSYRKRLNEIIKLI